MASGIRFDARFAGLAWTLCGAALFVAFPVARKMEQFAGGFWGGIEGLGQPLACLGSVLLIWGACTLVTGRLRSLTPARASVAPLVVAIPNAFAERIQPTVIDWGVGEPWQPPATPLELAERVFLTNGEIFVAATIFVVVGVATARGESRWRLFAVGWLVIYGAVWGTAHTTFYHGALFWPLMAAVPGVVPAAIGYLAAEPREVSERDEKRPADAATA